MNKELESNTILSHYRVVSKIGAGGMGEVYLAEDARLRRKVALKVLPESLAADADRLLRFEREAFAASALNHPNILTIYEFAREGDMHFLAAEFVAGETLRERFGRGSLTVSETLDIAQQIASALQAAHQAGIIHRDIKPENVMIRADGYVKVLDFGLAKLLEQAPADEEAETRMQLQTQAGMVMGTVAYMSPEQARGRAVDARTDIFSLGAVLYEMLARRQPFTGETVNHTIVAILEKDPPPVSGVVRDCPFDVERIVQKALAKERERRYQSAQELSADLKDAKQELEFQSHLERTSSPDRKTQAPTQIIRAAATAEEKHSTGKTQSGNSIVVLPFTNMSADAENEYFCDGLAEELLNALSKIEDLKVAARTSAFSFKGKNANVSEIGAKLSVRNVLEGSVRRSGNRLRISVQLINTADGYHLWSERYDREMKDIFDVQDEIALAVVDALKLKLFGEEKAAVLKRHTDKAEVYEIYLKGRYQFQKHTPEGWQKAIEYFQQAIDLDPEYAPALAGLSSVLIFQSFFGFATAREAIPKAKEAARRALEIDGELDEAHLAVGQVSMFYEWNLEKAAREYQTTIRLNPKSGFAHHQYGLCLTVLERREQAIYEADKAMEYEPLSVIGNLQAAAIYLWNDRDEGHLKYAQRLIEIAPNFFGGYFMKGVFFLKQGKYEDAISLFKEAASFDNRQGIVKSFLGRAFALAGNKDKAFDCIKELQADLENNKAASYQIAGIYSSIGDLDKTFEWLEKAFEERNGELIYLKLYANWRDGEIWGREFRTDPRFRDLLRRIGFSPDKTNQTDESLEAQTVLLKSKTTDDKQGEIASEIAEKSIAVLPFTDMSADGDQEYFCDGLAEELLNALAKIDELKVAARTSAFAFKGKNANASEVGNILKVKTILEGSVRKSGNRLRISVQLVNAADGYQLWSEKYDRELKDIFDVQDEIALAVARALKLKLFGEEKDALLKRYTNNPEAYQLYLKGRFYFSKFTVEGFGKSVEYYEQALAIEPDYAPAFAALSTSYICFWYLGFGETAKYVSKAQAAVNRALILDQSLAEAHFALALVKFNYERNWTEAEKSFQKTIELNPNYAENYEHYGMFLAVMGRVDEAVTIGKRAIELAPLALKTIYIAGWAFWFAGQTDLAKEQGEKLLEMEPNFSGGHTHLGISLWNKGAYQKSLIALETAVKLGGGNDIKMLLGLLYGIVGEREKANQLLAEFERLDEQGIFTESHQAFVCAGLGEMDRAFVLLEQAGERHEGVLVFLKQFSSLYPKFHNDSRMTNLLNRLGLPTDKSNQTDESLEAKTATLSSSELKIELPADAETQSADSEPTAERPTNPKSKIQKPKSKWWLFGLLTLLLAVGGFFSYKYFTPNKQIESIAVMPFVNDSGNADVEYLSDGMTETLISNLSNLPNLNVKPRSSVFHYKGKETNPQTIGKELNVQAILNGRVVQRGNDISLYVELIDVALDKVIWSETYNRKQNDLVTLQTDIARDVSGKIKTKISGMDEAKVTKTYTTNAEAYQLYLKGNYYKSKYTDEGYKKAVEYYKQAIEIEPNYALAYVGIANTYISVGEVYLPMREAMPQAKAAVLKALEIDTTIAEAHALLGAIAIWYEWDWATGERELKKAVELDSNNAESHHSYGWYFAMTGRMEQAIAEGELAQRLDPLDININSDLTGFYNFAGRYDQALEQARETIEIDPNSGLGYNGLGMAYERKRQFPEAIAAMEKSHSLDNSPWLSGFRGFVYASAGRKAEAEKILNELKELSKRQYVPAYNLAFIYAGLNDKDQAFEWLNKAYETHSGLFVIKVETTFDNLRLDPRFKDLLKRMNLPE